MDAAAATSFAKRFRWQAQGCDRLGSALYGELCRRVADDIEAGGPLFDVLVGRERAPLDSMLQLRLLGALHRMALRGEAPELAARYPSTGGDGSVEGAWRALRATVVEHRGRVRELLEPPVQTNEVGRSRALAVAFTHVARRAGLPLRLLELGASGGLNLRWDRFRYESGRFVFGDPDAPVRFADYHEGADLPSPPEAVEVAERAGCDQHPVDAASSTGAETLRSYIWPDQLERLALLDAALEVARAVPVTVDRAAALPWLSERLAEPAAGVCTVVFHSIMMQYVDPAERDSIDALFADAGSRATPDAPLARVAFEAAGAYADMHLTLWPGGERVRLAECGYHGTPVRWLAG